MTWFSTQDEDRMEEARKTVPCPDFRRAGGGCICAACGKEYRQHPQNDPWLWLHTLCDGSHVKL